MEEPSWLQQDSLQASHFSYTVNDSPPQTPKIKAHTNYARGAKQAAPLDLGPRQGKRPLLPQKLGNGMAGRQADESLDDIMSFVKEKVLSPLPHMIQK